MRPIEMVAGRSMQTPLPTAEAILTRIQPVSRRSSPNTTAQDVWVMETPSGESNAFALYDIGITAARMLLRVEAGGCRAGGRTMSGRRLACAVRWAAVAGLACLSAGSPVSSQGSLSVPVAMGLDHIPVAVRDLEAASTTYRALGFSLKPGRPHANGIRNAHVKFPDGAGIELLTVSAAVDPLSTRYGDMLRAGEGPAFLSFHARDTTALHAALRAGGYAFRDTNGLTDLSAPPFSFLFWIADNRSPTDRPEHFAHPNGATALGAVWIATDDGEALARLLVGLGGRQQRREVLAPDRVEATVVTLAEGQVFILPVRHQRLPGRPVIGASFRVRDLPTARRVLAAGGVSPWTGPGPAERVVVEPSKAHGLWLELVGPADRRYLVTSSVTEVSPRIRLCIAVDPRDPHGVWWWEPGASGCTSRSTGPTIFHAEDATVSPSARPGVTAVSFRLQLHASTPSFLDVRLAIEDGRMRLLDTGSGVALQRRNDLDLPWELPRR